MAQLSRRQRARRISELLREEGPNVRDGTKEFNAARYAATEDLEGYEALKDRARTIKEEAIADLPQLIEQLRASVESNGGHVYLADSPADANRYIERVAEEHQAETVVKSKSMTTEELDLNDHLAANEIDVYETDLGEFVIQIADEAPSHLTAPAIHRSRESIAELFNAHFDLDEPLETPTELTVFARDYLGERIMEADIGMTGANFLLADSGTLAIVTNEGNARKCAAVPDTHIAVAGVEKIIPSVEQLQPFVELIARSATGQHITRYVSLLSPPVETPTVDFDTGDSPALTDDDRSFHLVLVDNGRTDMRDDDVLREVLYCIRCSACLNSCANFQSVGGHGFGGETYTGGIGTGWEAGVESLDSAATFNDLCTGCSRCVNQCPVKIDIPWINNAIRSRITEEADPPALDFVYEGLLPDEEPSSPSLRQRLFANVDRASKWGSALAPVSNWLGNRRATRWLMERTLGIDARRPLPKFTRTPLTDRVSNTGHLPDTHRSAVVYVDAYTNYALVDRGLATLRLLEAFDVAVELTTVHSTGREPLSQGMIATAERRANELYDHVASALDRDTPIVFIEPSDLAMVRREFEHVLAEDKFDRIRTNSFDVFEYLWKTFDREAIADRLAPKLDDRSILYHSHCQQRTLGLESPTVSFLETVGYDVTTSDVECCGMAGSFGYKAEYFDLSMDVGSDLGQQIADEHPDRVVASGTSCLEQLRDLGVSDVIHPAELISPR